jgi:hypothetical protein
MRRREISIIGPLLRKIRTQNTSLWYDLKYQTLHGPMLGCFPYFPLALDFEHLVQTAIRGLSPSKKTILIKEWFACPRTIKLDTDVEIIAQYEVVLLEYIIKTAEIAALRTAFDR